ncbi:GAF domain-containing sensor histidine kinase [Nocardioides panacisoli]|uniref:Two-component system sensor histidine kinase n=1 Tax=Nocardioides panacisoli TaxID=627624 RepID=A0ABP7I7Z3_9ACTN
MPDRGLGEADFEELVREVQSRMQGALDQQARLQLLLDAVVSMAADLNLDGVLSRIVGIAGRLVDAKYAALGVLGDSHEQPLRTFITHGIDDEEIVRIGELPKGHGLLGLIIDRPEPLRLHDIAEHPASYGFPPNHPAMHSFLGVPVRIRDRVFGNLYLSEKLDGNDFTADDEEVVVALAAAAGVSIENARLYEEARRREAWLRATAEITALLTDPAIGAGAVQAVVDRAREVAEADVAWIVAGPSSDKLSVRAVSGFTASYDELAELKLEHSISGTVVDSGEPATNPDVASGGLQVSVGSLPGCPVVGSATAVPLGSGDSSGALGLAWAPEHADLHRSLDPELPASFARQAALALQVAQARDDQQRLVMLEDRDRIGRDLHDLVIQRLFAVGLGLQGTGRLADRPEVAERLERAVDDIDATIKDIRRTIFALGTVESSEDIQAEVTRLVDRAAAALKFRPGLRFTGPVRSLVGKDVAPDLLAVLGEALSNAVKHAEASSLEVDLAAADEIVLTVTDDGRGIAPDAIESGLANIRRRAEQRGGTFTVESAPGEGTSLRWAVPRG